MSKPIRHQRRRTKGSKLPPGVMCCTRPGKWGNPFETAGDFRIAFSAISQGYIFGTWDQWAHMARIVAGIEQLRGKDLACWCSLDSPCHVDTLLREANK